MGFDMVFYVDRLCAAVSYYIAAKMYGPHPGIFFFPGKNDIFYFICLQGMFFILKPYIIRPDFPLDIESSDHIHRHIQHLNTLPFI